MDQTTPRIYTLIRPRVDVCFLNTLNTVKNPLKHPLLQLIQMTTSLVPVLERVDEPLIATRPSENPNLPTIHQVGFPSLVLLLVVVVVERVSDLCRRLNFSQRLLLLLLIHCLRGTHLWGQHLGQLFVLQTTLQEFVLGQLAVVVLVHFRENVLCALFSRVRGTVR